MAESPLRILLVDDEQMIRSCFGFVLQAAGYNVRAVETAEEAFESLLSFAPQLIVLDVDLGGRINGIEVARRIRNAPAFRDVPILMMTGNSLRETVVEAAQVGVSGYVLKGNVSIADFLARVGKHADAIRERASVLPPSVADARAPGPASSPPAAPLSPQEVEERVARIVEARALPFVAAELLQTTNSPGSTLEDLTQLIQRDPAIAARVLQIANSSFYRGRQRITTIERAIVSLGFQNIRNLAVAVSVAHDIYGSGGVVALVAGWRHALACAVLAREFAARAGAAEPEVAMVGGLMHDLGRPLLAEHFSAFHPLVSQRVAQGAALCAAERDSMGIDHEEVVRRVLRKWKMPDEIVCAVVDHHRPWDELRTKPVPDLKTVAAIAAAERVLKTQAIGAADDDLLDPLPDDLCDLLRLDEPGLRRALESTVDAVNDMTSVIFLHPPAGGPLPEIPPVATLPTVARTAASVPGSGAKVDILSPLLWRFGYEVVPAATPFQALALRPAIVFARVDRPEEAVAWRRWVEEAIRPLGPAAPRMILAMAKGLPAPVADDRMVPLAWPLRVSAVVAALPPP